MTKIFYDASKVDFADKEPELNIDTPFEKFIIAAMAVFAFLTLACYLDSRSPEGAGSAAYIPYFGLGFIVFLGLYLTSECTYFLNKAKGTLDYSRTIFAMEDRFPVCRFEEIQYVTTNVECKQSKHGYFYVYNTAIVTNRNEVIAVTEKWQELAPRNELAKGLAEYIGTEYRPGVREVCTEISATPGLNGDISQEKRFIKGLQDPKVISLVVCMFCLFAFTLLQKQIVALAVMILK